jgi:hypothetical protein
MLVKVKFFKRRSYYHCTHLEYVCRAAALCLLAHLELLLALPLLVCCLLVGLRPAGQQQVLSWQQQLLLLAHHCLWPAGTTQHSTLL